MLLLLRARSSPYSAMSAHRQPVRRGPPPPRAALLLLRAITPLYLSLYSAAAITSSLYRASPAASPARARSPLNSAVASLSAENRLLLSPGVVSAPRRPRV